MDWMDGKQRNQAKAHIKFIGGGLLLECRRIIGRRKEDPLGGWGQNCGVNLIISFARFPPSASRLHLFHFFFAFRIQLAPLKNTVPCRHAVPVSFDAGCRSCFFFLFCILTGMNHKMMANQNRNKKIFFALHIHTFTQ